MSVERPPVAGQTDYKHWAERLNSFLTRTKSHLAFYVSGATAYRDGMLVWDDDNKTILYSGNGQWNTIGNGVAGADGTDGTDGTGFTGGSYDSNTGIITFTSNDGLGFSTTDVRGSNGADGDGFTGGSYNASTGIVTFTSDDGLGFSTTDIRGANGTDGDGFTGGSYNASTGVVTFTSDDGLGFSTGDLRGADGTVDYTQVSALYHSGNIKAEATADGVTVTGDVEATEFIGDLRGAVVFKAQAGEALTKGDVVYISGISGNTTVVSKADADDAAKMPAFGLAATDANNNANLEVYTFGTLSGLDTSSHTEGDELFVGTTAGALVSTAPTGESSSVQKIGKVTRSHASTGSIKIMGAGRTNATPNLNDGNIFIGDSNNQSVTTSLATQVSTLETSHDDVLVDGDFTSNGFMKRTGAGTYAIDSNTYLTSEANDLSTAVTWADVPDANITETSVTQHQAALSITESQISDFGTYLTTHQDISGKADLSGATFTGNVSVGIPPSGTQSLTVAGSANLYGGADLQDTNITDVDTLTAKNLDISTTGTVTTNISTGYTGSESSPTKTINIGTGYSTGGTTTVNICSTSGLTTKNINLNGNVAVSGNITLSGTVDGVDVSAVATTANSAMQDLVDDTTPQLGGNLDLNSNNITGSGTISATQLSAGANGISSSGGITAAQANIYGGTLQSGGNTNVGGDITVTGTVDGRDVATDGAKLDNLKYHKDDYIMIRDGNNKSLSTSFVDLGSYTYIYDAATPMPTMRYLDINFKILWGYSTVTNDMQIKVGLQVPSGTVTAQSIGSITQTSGGGYATISYYEKWFHVDGDVTHLFTEFGKLHENQSTGGTYERTVYAWQYDNVADRTYFLMSTYPSAPANGTTLYWHPYAWESAGTILIEYKDVDERYMSGNQYANIVTKTAYTDATLKYNLQARELGSGDSAQVNQTYVKISKQEP